MLETMKEVMERHHMSRSAVERRLKAMSKYPIYRGKVFRDGRVRIDADAFDHYCIYYLSLKHGVQVPPIGGK